MAAHLPYFFNHMLGYHESYHVRKTLGHSRHSRFVASWHLMIIHGHGFFMDSWTYLPSGYDIHSSPWYRWLIEIDGKNLGLPKKNNFIVIFHGELLNNQRVNEIKMDMKTSMHLQLAQVENRKN